MCKEVKIKIEFQKAVTKVGLITGEVIYKNTVVDSNEAVVPLQYFRRGGLGKLNTIEINNMEAFGLGYREIANHIAVTGIFQTKGNNLPYFRSYFSSYYKDLTEKVTFELDGKEVPLHLLLQMTKDMNTPVKRKEHTLQKSLRIGSAYSVSRPNTKQLMNYYQKSFETANEYSELRKANRATHCNAKMVIEVYTWEAYRTGGHNGRRSNNWKENTKGRKSWAKYV